MATKRVIIKRLRIENKVLEEFIKKALYLGEIEGSKHKQFIKLGKMIRKEIRKRKEKAGVD